MFFAYSLIIGCSLMHIFCCGIPLLITILGLSANLGFALSGAVDNSLFENFEKFEIEILIISGLVLLLAFAVKYKAGILNCCKGEAKEFCKKEERINGLFLKVSSVLYLVNLLTASAEHFI